MTKRNVVKLMDTTPMVFTIIGISSHENDYRLSWSINEQLKLSFMQHTGIKTGDSHEFSCFLHQDDERRLQLISNRCDDGFLLEKHKNIDFILKIDADLNETETAEWIRDVRKVPLVSAAFQIPVNKQILKLLG